MPENDGRDTRPVPDPTVLTTQAVDKAIAAAQVYTANEIEHLRELVFSELKALRNEMNLLTSAAKDAIEKAEAGTDKRFDSLSQVSEAQRAELQKSVAELAERVGKVV